MSIYPQQDTQVCQTFYLLLFTDSGSHVSEHSAISQSFQLSKHFV